MFFSLSQYQVVVVLHVILNAWYLLFVCKQARPWRVACNRVIHYLPFVSAYLLASLCSKRPWTICLVVCMFLLAEQTNVGQPLSYFGLHDILAIGSLEYTLLSLGVVKIPLKITQLNLPFDNSLILHIYISISEHYHMYLLLIHAFYIWFCTSLKQVLLHGYIFWMGLKLILMDLVLV